MSICHTTSYFFGFCVSLEEMQSFCYESKTFKSFYEQYSSRDLKDKSDIDSDTINDWLQDKYKLRSEMFGDHWSGDDLCIAVIISRTQSVPESGFVCLEAETIDPKAKRRLRSLAKKLNSEVGWYLASSVS